MTGYQLVDRGRRYQCGSETKSRIKLRGDQVENMI